MTWLALAALEEFEIESFGTWAAIRCPEHGSIGTIAFTSPISLKKVFRKIKEHVQERHMDAG